MKLYELFIDELGHSNPISKQSDIYILLGCVIERFEKENIKIKADQIKFKYWGKTDVIFHSRDLGRSEEDFRIFVKNKKKDEFLNDLYAFLNNINIAVFAVIVDKKSAKEKGWNSIKVIKETAKKLYYHFIAWLMANGGAKGKIIVESATAEKDRYYLNEFSYFLSPGCKELSISYKLIQEILTSISFVTKRNYDIEEQIADLFAYSARCKYMRITKKETYKVGTYEDRMIKILERKIFKKPKFAKEKKMHFYETIDPFCIIPK